MIDVPKSVRVAFYRARNEGELDMQDRSSVLKWMGEQGHDEAVSWVEASGYNNYTFLEETYAVTEQEVVERADVALAALSQLKMDIEPAREEAPTECRGLEHIIISGYVMPPLEKPYDEEGDPITTFFCNECEVLISESGSYTLSDAGCALCEGCNSLYSHCRCGVALTNGSRKYSDICSKCETTAPQRKFTVHLQTAVEVEVVCRSVDEAHDEADNLINGLYIGGVEAVVDTDGGSTLSFIQNEEGDQVEEEW